MFKSMTFNQKNDQTNELEMEELDTTRLPLNNKKYQQASDRSNIPHSNNQTDEFQSLKIQQFSMNPSISQSPDYMKYDVDPNYQILDLTYTFIIENVNLFVSAFIFLYLLLLRYYTLGCFIFIVIVDSQEWEWVFVIIASRFVYFAIVIKISLKSPETKTEIILKTYWNSKETGVHELFQVINTSKLCTSLARACIPPQLSFLYINTRIKKKKLEIYAAIIYYPFFIAYCVIINPDNGYALNVFNPNFTIVLAVLGQFLLFALSIYLIYAGCQRKYGICRCLSSR